jgi:hypothetical protein
MDGERRAMNESDHQNLVQALNTILGVTLGERLDSIRHEASEMDSKLSTRIGAVKNETMESLDSLQKVFAELKSRTADSVTDVRKQITESTASRCQQMEAKMAETIAVAKRETTDSMDKLQHSVLSRTAEMIGRLSKVEDNQQRILGDLEGQTTQELEKQLQVRVLAVKSEMDKDVSGLRRELVGVRDELKLQRQATERVSAFLNSMASVFSVSPPQPQPQPQPQANQSVPAGPDPVPFEDTPKLTREEVDNAVERALGEEWSPGKTVEIPNPLFRGGGRK